jgi:hypothetical protein
MEHPTAVNFGYPIVQLEDVVPAVLVSEEPCRDPAQGIPRLDRVEGLAIELVDRCAGQCDPQDPAGVDVTGVGEAAPIGHLPAGIRRHNSTYVGW